VILITGGTGSLGREALCLLTSNGLRVRVLTREPARARDLESDQVEIVAGDVRNPASLGPALIGVQAVISAMSGYGPLSRADPRTVDGEGNCNLIRASERAGAGYFVLISVHAAAPDHPMELMRMKFLAEQRLKQSHLAWTIIRPTLFMETWATVVGRSLLKERRAVIFGRGENPINFVSLRDVAHLIERALVDSSMRFAEVDIGGPQNLTLKQFVATLAGVTGRENRCRQIPRPVLQLMSILAKRINPTVARLAHDAVVMDTRDFTFDMPAASIGSVIPMTSLAEVFGPGQTTERGC
jgi:NADH dehydrogenase